MFSNETFKVSCLVVFTANYRLFKTSFSKIYFVFLHKLEVKFMPKKISKRQPSIQKIVYRLQSHMTDSEYIAEESDACSL